MRGLELLQPYCHKPVPGQYGGEAGNPEQWSLKHVLHLYFSVLRDKPFPFLFKLVWTETAVTGTQESLWVYVAYVKISRKGWVRYFQLYILQNSTFVILLYFLLLHQVKRTIETSTYHHFSLIGGNNTKTLFWVYLFSLNGHITQVQELSLEPNSIWL